MRGGVNGHANLTDDRSQEKRGNGVKGTLVLANWALLCGVITGAALATNRVLLTLVLMGIVVVLALLLLLLGRKAQ